jgi:putative colanic acid biosynthesis UDP-glucose lipid carrier transferase
MSTQSAPAARTPARWWAAPTISGDYRVLLPGIFKIYDALSIFGMSLVAYWTRHGDVAWPFDYAVATLLGALLFLYYASFASSYQVTRSVPVAMRCGRVVICWMLSLATIIAVGFFERNSDDFSRVWLVFWFMGGAVALVVGRLLVFPAILHELQRSGKLANNVVVVGSYTFVEAVSLDLAAAAINNKIIAGYEIDDAGPVEPQRANVVNDLLALVRRTPFHEVFVQIPSSLTSPLHSIVSELRALPVDLNVCLMSMPLTVPVQSMEKLGTGIVFNVGRRPVSGWSRLVKRAEDVILASALLLGLAPIMLVIAAMVALTTRGPILFRQIRYGIGNSPIPVLKFRTMYHVASDDDRQAKRDDPRVTRVGRFFRKSSLDELPQLFNVLKGDMSLVGPRPHAVSHNEFYATLITDYNFRHRVKPGLTGWAQVNGLRGETADIELMKRRIEHDLYYIENWSLAFDLRILCLTLVRGFFGKNAY